MYREIFSFKEEIQAAYERLPLPFAIYQFINNEVVVLVVSDGYCEMFGYDEKSDAYSDLKEFVFANIHPKDLARIEAEAARIATESGQFDLIYRAHMKDSSEYKVIRAVGKPEVIEDDVHLVHIWYTDETNDVNQKIIELSESVTSLLTNMPAMTFSKDVFSGKYLACNQAFADYAHKETPEGVVGLTDFEIFDHDTAAHFVADDKKAMTMDKPHIFFEDVPDAAGNSRRFQTSKLKFIDTNGRECLLGLCQDVTEAMIIKKEYDKRLANARDEANIDALTGIRNKHAYLEMEDDINRLISEHRQQPFAITIFDVNDLKKVNDNLGHSEGDKFICAASIKICKEFKHSPVFRIGGDEFVAISKGNDYEKIDELMALFDEYNDNAKNNGGIVIACGMAKYDNDKTVSHVFERADRNMYENKKRLKADN